MSSNAPLRAVIGTSSARRTEALTAEVVTDPPAKPADSNSYSKPSAAKNPCSSATHSCNRTCGWIRNVVIRLLLEAARWRRLVDPRCTNDDIRFLRPNPLMLHQERHAG